MNPGSYHLGIKPDSGRKKWKMNAPNRCPQCKILVRSSQPVCPVCSQFLYCPRKAYNRKLMAVGTFLSFASLLLAVLFLIILDLLGAGK